MAPPVTFPPAGTVAGPPLPPREAAYARVMDEALAMRLRRTTTGLSDLAGLWERIWAETRAELAEYRPGFGGAGGWTASDISALDAIVSKGVTRLEAAMRGARRQALRDMWTLGSEATAEAVNASGTRAYWGGGAADAALLGTMADYQDTLVTRITREAAHQVRSQIRLGVLGAKAPSYIMQDLRAVLGTAERESIGPLWRQVDTVWRTEAMNILNGAAWQRAVELARQVPHLRKRWRHGGGGKEPRPYHQKVLHGQTLPWDAPFTVITPKGEAYQALHPHAPTLPAGEVISCTCGLVLVTWAEEGDAAMDDALARARMLSGKTQLEQIRSQRPDLLQTPDGKDWVRRYRKLAWAALQAGY